MRLRSEAGFTLVEVIVVAAIVALAASALGTFFLGGASPALASADRDVLAAIDEARRTAAAFDTATLVFVPALTGTGYIARVYARTPGQTGFVPRNGPAYESAVAVTETAQPLGAPGFALAFDTHGTVTGYANFVPPATAFAIRACPASGAFVVQLTAERGVRTVSVPCLAPQSGGSPLAIETASPGYIPTPAPVQTCPANVTCVLSAPVPGAPPPSTAPVTPPPPANTPCPAGFSGTAPACTGDVIEQYSAGADDASAHMSTLFADGNLCDDDGCSPGAPAVWNWACPFSGRSGSNGNDGSNVPYYAYTPFYESVSSMIGRADHDAAQGPGDGLVSTEDTYCPGFLPSSP